MLSMSPYDDGWLMGIDTACFAACLYGKHSAMLHLDAVQAACAEAAHTINKIYCESIGDTSQLPWDRAPQWQKDSAINGVKGVYAGNGPEQAHESWLEEKRMHGWKYGPRKDPDRKEHPCFVPYGELPSDQKKKDHLFVATVRSMAAALGHPVTSDDVITAVEGLKVSTRQA